MAPLQPHSEASHGAVTPRVALRETPLTIAGITPRADPTSGFPAGFPPEFWSDFSNWSDFPTPTGASSSNDPTSTASTSSQPSSPSTITSTATITANSSNTSLTSSSQPAGNNHSQSASFSRNPAAIAGVSVAVVLVCIAIAMLAYLISRRRSRNLHRSSVRESLSSVTPFVSRGTSELASGTTESRTFSSDRGSPQTQARETQRSAPTIFQGSESPPEYSEILRFGVVNGAGGAEDGENRGTAGPVRAVSEKR